MAVNRDTRVFCGSQDMNFEDLLALAWLLLPPGLPYWPKPWNTIDSDPAWRAMMALGSMVASRAIEVSTPDSRHPGILHTCPPQSIISHQVEQATSPLNSRLLSAVFPFKCTRPLAVILAEGAGLEATDPQDKVYALYNIDKQFTRKSLIWSMFIMARPKVDYTIPWEEVFIRTAEFLCTIDAETAINLTGRSQQGHDANMPSWVPDFRNLYLLETFSAHSDNWAADGRPSRARISLVKLPTSRPGTTRSFQDYSYVDEKGKKRAVVTKALSVTAILQDKIVYCSAQTSLPSDNSRPSLDEMTRKLATDLGFVNKNISQYFTGESGVDAYSGTIIVNTTSQSVLASAEYEREGFTGWRAWLASPNFPNDQPDYHRAVENIAQAKFFFTATSHGLLRLAPVLAREGDYVAILKGCRYSVALRKVGPEDGHYYEPLGQCYIHRMMRGRAWSLIQEFKSKYQPGSEDEIVPLDSGNTAPANEEFGGNAGVFPFNDKSAYRNIVRVLGEIRIALI
ncbi:hypothetical protein CBER1_10723 [Cercospora berteroae]|uniref:Heterokaryon incompatibility domain-containing protein n=1 Tax=Cercospora berteroae TaxID=357750 RepID=A0A2S6BYG8_9PEZI|nr:hypothetical protein CBER1_10723 [Cercospora berteroae]